MAIPPGLFDVIKDIMVFRPIRLAISAFILSVGILASVLFIFGFYSSESGLLTPSSLSTTILGFISVGFILLFFIIWFIFYIQGTREAEDLYSNIRKKLCGHWYVLYQASNGQSPNVVPDAKLAVVCTIQINSVDRKLEMIINVTNDPIYEDNKQIINTISVFNDEKNKYSLCYYYRSMRSLKEDINNLILDDQYYSREVGLEVEFFGIVHFEEDTNTKEIKSMEGEWFDLNGKVTQLFALVDEARRQPNRLANPRYLGDVELTTDNFHARMGSIKYLRIQDASPMPK